ncbi:MAG: polysaccharide biosynthesis protein [Planctomycetota bacterium]
MRTTFAVRPLAAVERRPWLHSAVCVAIDLGVLAMALLLAFLVRYEGWPHGQMATVLIVNLPLALALQYGAMALLRVPSRSWSYVGATDVLPIVAAVSAASLVLLVVRYGGAPFADEWPVLHSIMLPVSVIVLDATLAILGLCAVRCLRSLQTHRRRRLLVTPAEQRHRALLIGAGWSGSVLVRELRDRADLGLEPVAFLDDDPCKVGRRICGIPVAGTTEHLDLIARRLDADTALIAIANADSAALHRIVERCKAARLTTKIVPHYHEILSGKVRVSQMRDVAIEDLLGRKPVEIERSAAPAAVAGKTAIVTGAGGSIGSELCRQIVQLKPRRLVLVERAENCLYQIHRELFGRDLGVEIVQELADVTDARRMECIFEDHEPDIVFHAAAHKHVPMMEEVPGEAIKNNVFGTKTVADLAHRFEVERFLLVSTDKAVNPSSVMGATKRCAELYIKDLDARSDVRFVSVRFGNVMGSAGSVIPLFREQIARGGPLTVTHPQMERFFMTIPEASRLVLEAAALGDGGEVMLLDMGEPVRIQHLAEQMIRLSGFEPGLQIRIEYTGVRPGEKLYEELALPEELVDRTACPKVFVWRGGSPTVPIARMLEELAAPGRTADEIRATLRRVLPEYRKPAQTPPAHARTSFSA